LEFIFGDLVGEFTRTRRACSARSLFHLAAKVEHIAAIAGAGDDAVVAADVSRSIWVPERSEPTHVGCYDRRDGNRLAQSGQPVVGGAGQEEEAFALVPMVADFLRKARPEVVQETGHRLEKRAYALIGRMATRNTSASDARCSLAHGGSGLAIFSLGRMTGSRPYARPSFLLEFTAAG